MAVVNTTLYSYFDLNLSRHFLRGSELDDRGSWSSITAYTTSQVVLYDSNLYVALQNNTNVIPSGTVTDHYWSPLVVIAEAAPIQSSGSDSYARGVAEQALATAQAAYTIATAGTQLGSNAYTLAQAAYTMATTGTQIGSNAYALAVSGSATLQLLINGSLTIDRLILRDQVTHQSVIFVVNDGQFQNP